MSSLRINGQLVFSVSPSAESSAKPQPAPGWDTHRLVDGCWIPKGQPSPSAISPAKARLVKADAPKNPIGFKPVSAADSLRAVGQTPMRCLGSRSEYLSAISKAAGQALVAAKDQEVLGMIRRGRLGGRKDNMTDLQWLLWRYERAA